jgi:hypothetical protein
MPLKIGEICDSFRISDYDHELMYGEAKIANDMKHE